MQKTTVTYKVDPSTIMGKSHGYIAPSDKLNIAVVGLGSMGISNIKAVFETENIVALCDVDWKYSKPVLNCFPNTRKYMDFRKMFDEMSNDIDAVIIATPDHTHATIAATAMTLSKHVYVQKPLTHSIYESRLLTGLAAKYNVATQMGNQGSSDEGVDLICEWIWNGEIGEVKKVEAATNRPMWPQGLETPVREKKIPPTLDWDLFIGPAKMRPYNSIYHPWNWRGWWDFGTGVLGDMGCHILHPVFKALKLGHPVSVEAASERLFIDSAPRAEHVKFVYPAREKMPKVDFPEVEVHWYDGGFMPDRPTGFPQGRQLMDLGGGLTIFHGTKDTLICGCYGLRPWLLSGRVPDVPKTIRRVSRAMGYGHEQDWVHACKDSPENRVKTKSDFSEAGLFNEMIMMGILAVRLQPLNKILEWDGANMQFTNIGDNEDLKFMISDGFIIKEGHPSFNAKMSDSINAKEFASELIKHNYRTGWSLPEMP
jgi:Predicted dehydrogenases and related proteins